MTHHPYIKAVTFTPVAASYHAAAQALREAGYTVSPVFLDAEEKITAHTGGTHVTMRPDQVAMFLEDRRQIAEQFSGPHPGDLQVNATDYGGRIVIEEYGYWSGRLSWAVPAYEEQGRCDLEGPLDGAFATAEDAQNALQAYLADR